MSCFCKHQEDILVVTLWLADGGGGHFCRIRKRDGLHRSRDYITFCRFTLIITTMIKAITVLLVATTGSAPLEPEWAVWSRWIALHNLVRKYQHGVVRAEHKLRWNTEPPFIRGCRRSVEMQEPFICRYLKAECLQVWSGRAGCRALH